MEPNIRLACSIFWWCSFCLVLLICVKATGCLKASLVICSHSKITWIFILCGFRFRRVYFRSGEGDKSFEYDGCFLRFWVGSLLCFIYMACLSVICEFFIIFAFCDSGVSWLNFGWKQCFYRLRGFVCPVAEKILLWGNRIFVCCNLSRSACNCNRLGFDRDGFFLIHREGWSYFDADWNKRVCVPWYVSKCMGRPLGYY